MSEFIKIDSGRTFRWDLLAGVSVLALSGYLSTAHVAKAEESDGPQVWIELGGQFAWHKDSQEAFSPPIMEVRPSMFSSSQDVEKPPHGSIDGSGNFTLQPEGSDWTFSAAVRYGRASANRDVRQQTHPAALYKYYTFKPTPMIAHPVAAKFADTKVRATENHFVLDFQVGKDVGLGMFGGREGSAVVGLGLRFAQFGSKSNIALKSDPDWHFVYGYYPSLQYFGFVSTKISRGEPYHSNMASLVATRNFHGVGPSISWNASAPLAGDPRDSELSFDWGVNAALLFGRQKAQVHHQSTAMYHSQYAQAKHRVVIGTPLVADYARSSSVTVPNVGGFAGISMKYPNAKVTFGYRADFFFGAMDGGIDARRSENLGFHGPYSSISIGLP